MTFDMSEAFNAETTDTFTVIRRKETVNNFGESATENARIPHQVGSVNAGDDNKIAIATDQQHIGKSISVVTQFKLRSVSEAKKASVGKVKYQPDLVFWNGDYFKVVVVEDYSRFGFGWIQAQCTSEDFVDQAPASAVKKSAMDC